VALRYTHYFNILTPSGENMKLKQLGFLLLTTSILTYAGNTNIYDMDIGDIKLDMSPEDVIKNLQSKYKITKEKIRIDKRSSEFYKGKYISTVKLLMTNMNLYVHFGEIPPVDKAGSEKVESIVYWINDTKENKEMLKEMVFQKYGEPDSIRKGMFSKTYYDWCEAPIVDDNKGAYPNGKKCEKDKPKLTLQGINLEIKNPLGRLKRKALKEQSMNVTPSF